jgi:hypothetical protein
MKNVSDRTARHALMDQSSFAINVKDGEFALEVSRVTVTAQNYRFKNYVSSLSLRQKKAVFDRNDDKASMKALTARLTLQVAE